MFTHGPKDASSTLFQRLDQDKAFWSLAASLREESAPRQNAWTTPQPQDTASQSLHACHQIESTPRPFAWTTPQPQDTSFQSPCAWLQIQSTPRKSAAPVYSIPIVAGLPSNTVHGPHPNPKIQHPSRCTPAFKNSPHHTTFVQHKHAFRL